MYLTDDPKTEAMDRWLQGVCDAGYNTMIEEWPHDLLEHFSSFVEVPLKDLDEAKSNLRAAIKRAAASVGLDQEAEEAGL